MRTIIKMVQLTRLDCAIASAGIMRMALAQAIHHARHRSVFQKRLGDQPMMQAVLADMALEVEAATALVMRLAVRSISPVADPREAARARLLTPAVKYWVCKTAPGFVYEAMECLGGNGYVEESVLPRLYREAPVNAIWEGSGNVMCLDVLRALAHEGDAARAVLDALASRGRRSAGSARGRRLRRARCCRRRMQKRGARRRRTSRAAGGGRGIAHSAPPKSPSCLRARGCGPPRRDVRNRRSRCRRNCFARARLAADLSSWTSQHTFL